MRKNSILGVVSGILALVVASAGGAVSAASVSVFVDVPADYEFREAIGFLKDKKIVQGYPDQTYKPEANISRAEFVKIALKLGGRGDQKAGTGAGSGTAGAVLFLDVHKDDWFFEDVMTAARLGVVQGAGAGKTSAFLPNDKITRVQALKIAFKALQYEPNVSHAGDIAPSDVVSGTWYFSQVMSARRLNILTDNDDGLFYPNQIITRGMAAEILFRVQMVRDQKGAAVDVTRGWASVDTSVDGVIFRIPKSWIAFKDGSRVIVIKKDPRMSADYELVTPLSAKVVVKTATLSAGASGESETSETYFEKMKAMSMQAYGDGVKFSSITLMGRPALDVMVASRGIENWYVWMPGNGVVSIYGQYGIGSLSLKMRESIRGIVRTLAVKEVGVGVGPKTVDSKLVSDIQAKVLVEKVGKTTIDSLGDALIIETDDIGVGTGAVDYYFSDKTQLSLKYERASDTILAVRTGKTTAF